MVTMEDCTAKLGNDIPTYWPTGQALRKIVA